jgi:hypothetical protein
MAQMQERGAATAQTWKIVGEQIGVCNCHASPCPCVTASGNPTEGECVSFYAFNIKQGSYGDVDLSGVKAAMVAKWSGFVLDGNWEAGLLIDGDDRQMEAITTIFSGQAGGPFGELAPLIGKFLGTEKASISFNAGDHGVGASVSFGKCHAGYEPLNGPGGRTQLVHGALAFRDVVYPGKSVGGHIDAFGIAGDTYYGEWADVELNN